MRPLVLLDMATVLAIDRALHDHSVDDVQLLDQVTRRRVTVQITRNRAGCRSVAVNGSVVFIVPLDGGDDSEYSRLVRHGNEVTVVCTLARGQWGLLVNGAIKRRSPCMYLAASPSGSFTSLCCK